METTLQPSFQQAFQSKITFIEAIEITILGFALWCLGAYHAVTISGERLVDQLNFLVGLEILLLGSWVIYNAYIRISRILPARADIRLRILLASLTATYTFWAWLSFDINRFIVAKLFYRGEAPVEYAWSAASKHNRRTWEQARKAGQLQRRESGQRTK